MHAIATQCVISDDTNVFIVIHCITGSASLDNVEFFHSGQEGYTATYDPRYSLAYLGLENAESDRPNRVVGCSFHHGFAPAIGLYNSHMVDIESNVIHHTVGQG